MQNKFEKSKDVLMHVERLLEFGKTKEAVEMIRHHGWDAPELRNAYGVCLLRNGDATKAVELYRDLVLGHESIMIKPGTPVRYVTNFATALLLTNNVNGCLSMLHEVIGEANGGAARLRGAVAKWLRTLHWWQRLWIKLGGEISKKADIDFPPGEVLDAGSLREAA